MDMAVGFRGDLDSVCWSFRFIFNSNLEGRLRLARKGGITRLLPLLPFVALPQLPTEDTLTDFELAESSSVN